MDKKILSEQPRIEIIKGDCLEVLKAMPENSIECVITDPPAGIGFMGKEWDSFGKGLSAREKFIGWLEMVARECLRVLKPGAHALVWALPRTSHWTATAWENAGWEVRDRIIYCFGSGFPKSLNIGKAVDKILGNEREIIKSYKVPDIRGDAYGTMNEKQGGSYRNIEINATRGFSEWEGWGTALKPAVEDWWLLRKPLEKGLNVAENVLKWGTGGLNINACRVEYINEKDKKYNTEGLERFPKTFANTPVKMMTSKEYIPNIKDTIKGRFPSHLIHDGSEEVVSLFPNSKGWSSQKHNKFNPYGGNAFNKSNTIREGYYEGYNDEGSASRFFYCAKASRKEREIGLEEIEATTIKGRDEGQDKRNVPYKIRPTPLRNNHPTVKPIKLMEYLVKLITPPNGIVLDCFMGSGSTGIACVNLGKNFIGIEIDKDYYEIAKKRIEFAIKKRKNRLF